MEGPEGNIIFLTVELTSSQLLWLLLQDLHKIKPSQCSSMESGGS